MLPERGALWNSDVHPKSCLSVLTLPKQRFPHGEKKPLSASFFVLSPSENCLHRHLPFIRLRRYSQSLRLSFKKTVIEEMNSLGTPQSELHTKTNTH